MTITYQNGKEITVDYVVNNDGVLQGIQNADTDAEVIIELDEEELDCITGEGTVEYIDYMGEAMLYDVTALLFSGYGTIDVVTTDDREEISVVGFHSYLSSERW